MTPVQQAVADAHRHEWTGVLAATLRLTRDLDLAEECVQDAFFEALDSWARHGVPSKPGAWLTTAARHNAIDALRRADTLRSKLHLLVEPATADDTDEADAADDVAVETAADDDRLRLVFLCCHPALATASQVALTLRLVCGVSTPAVARSLLVSDTTMAARITRAKKKIVSAGIPFRMPTPDELPERLDAVLTTVHLLYSAGHTSPTGSTLADADVADAAIDMARMLHELLPDEREVCGLLALLLANHARRSSRTTAHGELVTMEVQDRSTWDQQAIAEADRLVVGALTGGNPGRFALQAAIAALHATAPTYDETDWEQILVIYDELLRVWPSPVVALNRLVARSMVDGPAAALVELDELEHDERLAGYHYLPATRADLLRRLGRHAAAAPEYERALALVDNDAERTFLTVRLAESAAREHRSDHS